MVELSLLGGAAYVGVSFAVIVLAARVAGTERTLQAVRVWHEHGQSLQANLEEQRRRYGASIGPAGRGVMEAAIVPAFLFLPLLVVFWERSFGNDAVGVVVAVLGLALSVCAMVFGLYGLSDIALAATLLAWLPWAILVVAGYPLVAVAIGFLAGTATGVWTYRRLAALRREHAESGPAGS